MEIKLGKAEERLIEESLKDKLLSGAVEHILSKLDEVTLKAFFMQTLERAFGDAFSYDMQNMIRDRTKPLLQKILDRPEVKDIIHKAVETGANKALEQTAEIVEKELMEGIRGRVRAALFQELSRRQ